MTLKVTEGHWNGSYLIGHMLHPITVVWSVVTMSLSCTIFEILPISSCSVRDCLDLENTFTFDKALEITSQVRFPIHV